MRASCLGSPGGGWRLVPTPSGRVSDIVVLAWTFLCQTPPRLTSTPLCRLYPKTSRFVLQLQNPRTKRLFLIHGASMLCGRRFHLVGCWGGANVHRQPDGSRLAVHTDGPAADLHDTLNTRSETGRRRSIDRCSTDSGLRRMNVQGKTE